MEALQRLHNRGSISTGYEIGNSIKFEADNDEQLYRTPSSDGNMKTWTYSVWFKRTELGASQTLISALDTYMYFETNDTAWLNLRSASTNFFMATNRQFRDTSAWYHAVIVCDLTDGTAADRLKLYINGVRETAFSNNTYENADSNDNTGMNKATVHRIGQYSNYGSKFCGYMAEINQIDGQALAPTEFGEVDSDTGIWIPKEYTGSYGTNGFYLDFADAADLGDDESGNGNDFTEGAIAAADQATDTPTNNFATMNPLVPTADVTVSEGGTKVAASGGVSSWDTSFSSVGVTSGKWYFECRGTATDGTHLYGCVDEADIALVLDDTIGSNAGGPNAIGYYGNNGNIQISGSQVVSASSWPHNTTMALALDLDNGKAYFGRHNVWQNSANPANGTNGISLPTGGTGTWFFAINASYFDGGSMNTNHGGYTAQTPDSAASDENGYGTFEFAPPSGYYALCTKNLEEYG
jgi:hypothetical protein